MKKFTLFFSILILVASCNSKPEKISMDNIAELYVKLVLEAGLYDSDFVDAYYGPEEWKPTAAKLDSFPADQMIARAQSLIDQCQKVDTAGFSELDMARLSMFKKQLRAVKTKFQMMGGEKLDFDKEANLIYDAQPPHYSEKFFKDLISELDSIVPGEGELSKRIDEFNSQFIIPKDKLDTVFQVTIAEARKRTLKHIPLPENENFRLEYVTDKSWSGYNYYQGNFESLIQINTDFPIYIQRAIDLACHEGYPGHHVYNALLEKNLVNDKGWKEFSVYPLFSPQSLIAEGSANYGINVAFPGEERIKFEKEVLFPLAGLDSSKAELYYRILDIKSGMSYSGNEAARMYLNGEITREEAGKWLEKYSLNASDRALQRTRFFDQYRSYVINYNLGKDIVASYVNAKGGTIENPNKRWKVFIELLSNPNTASDLQEAINQ